MAIHQNRMITLINAAIDYKSALTDLCQFVQKQLAERDAGQCSADDALAVIAHAAQLKFALRHPDSSPSVIALEYYHYQTHYKSNERHRLREERRRRERGAIPRPARIHPFLTDDLVPFDHSQPRAAGTAAERFNPKTIARDRPAYLTASTRAQIEQEATEALREMATAPAAVPAELEDEYDDDMLAELAIAQGRPRP